MTVTLSRRARAVQKLRRLLNNEDDPPQFAVPRAGRVVCSGDRDRVGSYQRWPRTARRCQAIHSSVTRRGISVFRRPAQAAQLEMCPPLSILDVADVLWA